MDGERADVSWITTEEIDRTTRGLGGSSSHAFVLVRWSHPGQA
jgi:hypothetical protein